MEKRNLFIRIKAVLVAAMAVLVVVLSANFTLAEGTVVSSNLTDNAILCDAEGDDTVDYHHS